MTSKQAFSFGFLARCAFVGLGTEQIKQAAVKAAGLLDAGVGLTAGALRTLGSAALPAAVVAPPALGALAGYGAAKLTDVGDDDVDALRDREVINTYSTETERLRHLAKLRRAARQKARQPRLYRP